MCSYSEHGCCWYIYFRSLYNTVSQLFLTSFSSLSSQLSITRKSSSSLDNLYTACVGGTDHFLGPIGEAKGKTNTEAFIDSLISPRPDIVVTNEVRSRKISAPETVNRNLASTRAKMELEDIDEASSPMPPFSGCMSMVKRMSISAENMQQEDIADAGESCTWKMFDTNDGYVILPDQHTQ